MEPDGTRLPNIIFVLADDMGYGDPSCYGATRITTGNMDRLAREGMRFTDAHSSSAVCTPSRYSALTGRYCWRTRLQAGVLWGHSFPLIEPERPTTASLLREHGYATAYIGKWHLGLGWAFSGEGEPEWDEDGSNIDYSRPLSASPLDHGFDRFFGISGSLDMPPYCFIEDYETVGIPDREKDPYNAQQRKGLMVEGWCDDEVDVTFAAKAVDFIEGQCAAHPGQPFYLHLATSGPHRPCMPPEFARGATHAGPRGDMVWMVDWVLGQVMDALDRLGIADETLLILTSDNGARPADVDGNTYGHKSCGDWRGQKADIWDGGHREPFIARWPGRIPAGSTCGELVCLSDLIATCAEVVGAGLPEGAAGDSISMLPLLLGRGPAARESVVHHSGGGMFGVRQANWKLILGTGSGGFSDPRGERLEPGQPGGQLYDLRSDPGESRNLWPERSDVVEKLTSLLMECRT
jgi:arylsulfatase A-like enzyme